MRALDENIKGFNLIELLVVVILIGVVSAIGYPNFNNWRSERETKDSVIKIKSLIDGINAQVQRGRYAFVQVHILDNKKEIIVTSRGMKPEKLASLINNEDSSWYDADTKKPDYANICNVSSDTYWDDDPDQGSDNIEVRQITLDNVATSWEDDDGAVCFSKNERWYSGAEQLKSSTDGKTSVDSFITICRRTTDLKKRDVDLSTGRPNSEHKYLYKIQWSRFGYVTHSKFDNKYEIDDNGNLALDEKGKPIWDPESGDYVKQQ